MSAVSVKLACGHKGKIWDHRGEYPQDCSGTHSGVGGSIQVQCTACEYEEDSGYPYRRACVPQVLRGWWLVPGWADKVYDSGSRTWGVLAGRQDLERVVRLQFKDYGDWASSHEAPGPVTGLWYVDSGLVGVGGELELELEAWRAGWEKLRPWTGRPTGGLQGYEWVLCALGAGARWGAGVDGWEGLVEARVACLKAEAEATGGRRPDWEEREAVKLAIARYVVGPAPSWFWDGARAWAEVLQEKEVAWEAEKAAEARKVAA